MANLLAAVGGEVVGLTVDFVFTIGGAIVLFVGAVGTAPIIVGGRATTKLGEIVLLPGNFKITGEGCVVAADFTSFTCSPGDIETFRAGGRLITPTPLLITFFTTRL